MKYLTVSLILAGAALLTAAIIVRGGTSQANSPSASQRTPVIVELFTSEGCSSCPPADELLKKLEQQQPTGAAQLIALEEHVDYWNSLGWTDPFSSSQFTLRQEQYSDSFRTQGAYTPQMIVDGRSEFVGSRERLAHQEIETAARNAKATIEITPGNSGNAAVENLSVRVGKLSGATSGDTPEVWLAVTESQLHSAVKAGENKGEDLQHASVVRRLQKIGEAKGSGDFSFTNDATVKLDSSWKRENIRLVAFVQEKKSRRVLAASSISIAQ